MAASVCSLNSRYINEYNAISNVTLHLIQGGNETLIQFQTSNHYRCFGTGLRVKTSIKRRVPDYD